MYLRVEYLEPFYDSLLMLDRSPATLEAMYELVSQAVLLGEQTPMLEAFEVRVIRTVEENGFPSLRLFYFVENGTVKILEVTHYDEDEP